MITNAGETQLVKSLGVQLGGRTDAPQPFEATKGSIRSGDAPVAPHAAIEGSKCPFAGTVTNMGTAPSKSSEPKKSVEDDVVWTPDAQSRLEKVPSFVRPFARMELERMAKDRGELQVTESLLDEAKEKFFSVG